MDEKELLDSGILKGLFDQGLMGIETETEFDGSGSSFTSAIVVVEELAKVDPAVSVVCGARFFPTIVCGHKLIFLKL